MNVSLQKRWRFCFADHFNASFFIWLISIFEVSLSRFTFTFSDCYVFFSNLRLCPIVKIVFAFWLLFFHCPAITSSFIFPRCKSHLREPRFTLALSFIAVKITSSYLQRLFPKLCMHSSKNKFLESWVIYHITNFHL